MRSRDPLGRVARNLMIALVVLGLPGQLVAQAATRALATRAQLEQLLATGKDGKGGLSDRERAKLKTRLEEGDFQTGDRLILKVANDTALSDTFTVRAGPGVDLPNMDPLSLKGVLRSELQDRVQQYLKKYIREPQVEATSLIRIGILGGVVRPGYYNVAPDRPMGEIIEIGGGVAPDGELKKASIQRDGAERWSKEDVRFAMSRGMSLDELGVQGGDEFTVGRRSAGAGPTLAIITGVVGLAATIVLLARN